MNFDYAIHSDFLIHWTGKDIDCRSDWYQSDKSKTLNETNAYLERFLNILKYGLWMTSESETLFLSGLVSVPPTPKCCFTELKVSESRKHAREYGRLGIGVKRPFIFNRFGRPLVYFGFGRDNSKDKFFKACVEELENKDLLNFFKPMNNSRVLNYDLYGESEWRVIFFEELLRDGKVVDPRDSKNKKEHDYFKSLDTDQQEKLKYLIPLDGWFSMIIYPSLDVKNGAQQIKNEDPNEFSKLIKQEITRIKENSKDHANRVEGGNWPIEVDLDACRNF